MSLSKVSSTPVVLLHAYGSSCGLISQIRNEGLKSFAQLLREGKVSSRYKSLPDQNDLIYFRYIPGVTRECIPDNTVGIEVDPSHLNVHNQEFRASGNLRLYNDSKLLLTDYIERKELARKMGYGLEVGEAVIFHPLTASPIICKPHQGEHKISGGEFYDLTKAGLVGWGQYEVLYLNEVTSAESNIPAEYLLFPSNQKEVITLFHSGDCKGLP